MLQHCCRRCWGLRVLGRASVFCLSSFLFPCGVVSCVWYLSDLLGPVARRLATELMMDVF